MVVGTSSSESVRKGGDEESKRDRRGAYAPSPCAACVHVLLPSACGAGARVHISPLEMCSLIPLYLYWPLEKLAFFSPSISFLKTPK